MNKMHLYLEKRNIMNYLQGIKDAGIRASSIVANMLQFSRKSEVEKKPANINTIIKRSVKFAENDFSLNKKYDFRKIKIIENLNDNLPEIPCHETEIEQVFLNILKNAADAISGMNDWEVDATITLSTHCNGDYLQISIADNGPGLSDAVKDHIFEPFFTTKKVGSGTGLGMAICFFIITNNHGGQLIVESEEGQGTEFVISLPLSPE